MNYIQKYDDIDIKDNFFYMVSGVISANKMHLV